MPLQIISNGLKVSVLDEGCAEDIYVGNQKFAVEVKPDSKTVVTVAAPGITVAAAPRSDVVVATQQPQLFFDTGSYLTLIESNAFTVELGSEAQTFAVPVVTNEIYTAPLYNLVVLGGVAGPPGAALPYNAGILFIDDGPVEGYLSGAYKEILPAASVFPTSMIWWTSAAKTAKILELTITYTGPVATTEEWKVYHANGVTVVQTITDTIAYSTVFETSRTRVIT